MRNWKTMLAALLALTMLLALGSGIAMAEAAKELPDLPEEISAVIGGLPTSLDDLPEEFDPARLKAIYEAVDFAKVAHELHESGSSTFSDGGVDWKRASMFLGDDDSIEVSLSLSAADNGQVTVTVNDTLPNDVKGYGVFFLYSKDVNAIVHGGMGTPEEDLVAGVYQNSSFNNEDWSCDLEYTDGTAFTFSVHTEAPFRSWSITFDEQGQIIDKYYYSDEEAQPAEDAEPAEAGDTSEQAETEGLNYTPGEDLLLMDTGEVKVWLCGEKDAEFGKYNENTQSYPWYTFRIDNDSDQEIVPEFGMVVDGYNLGSPQYHSFGAHSSEEETWDVSNFDIEGYDGGVFFMRNPGADEAALDAVVNHPGTLNLDIELFEPTWDKSGDSYEDLKSVAKTSVTVNFAGSATEPEPAETGDSEGATYTVDDYIGTWYLNRAYLANNGYTVDVVEYFGMDPYEYMVTIEPGKVTITSGDSHPGVFEGELAVIDNWLYVMVDEENYYTTCVFTLTEADDGQLLAWPLTSGDISFYTKEAPKGPGKVHKDKATVKAVQQALNDAGYECGKPDGAAGKKTKAAITAYQTDKGLTVTGTVTDELLRSLGLK